MNDLDRLGDAIYWLFLLGAIAISVLRRLSRSPGPRPQQKEVPRLDRKEVPVRPKAIEPYRLGKKVTSRGRVIARSIRGERVIEIGNQLWLARPNGEGEQISDEWLDNAFKSGGWRDVYKGWRDVYEEVEARFPRPEERVEPIRPPSREEEISTETPSQHDRMEAERALHELWETEIASKMSFYDKVKPEMLSHVPLDKRAFALQEYARLHPDEAYWDGQALVRRGKT